MSGEKSVSSMSTVLQTKVWLLCVCGTCLWLLWFSTCFLFPVKVEQTFWCWVGRILIEIECVPQRVWAGLSFSLNLHASIVEECEIGPFRSFYLSSGAFTFVSKAGLRHGIFTCSNPMLFTSQLGQIEVVFDNQGKNSMYCILDRGISLQNWKLMSQRS